MSGACFRLFACCIPVRGARRSTLCDLQRGEVRPIPNGLYDVLTVHRDRTLAEIKAAYAPEDAETIDQYFAFLVENEFGFWTDEPELFPDLDLGWEAPERITNAVIDVGARSAHDFASLFRQLDDLGCKHLQLRFFVPVAPTRLDEVLAHTKAGRLRGIEILLPWTEEWTDERCLEISTRHPRLVRMDVHSAPAPHAVEGFGGFRAVHRAAVVDSAACCGQVAPVWFAPTLGHFTEAQRFNTCLNRKIAVDEDGEIRNCPSLPRSFGNARDTSLHAALLQADFRELWEINKDQVEVCRDCEFRYVCTDCRAFIRDPGDRYSKPSKCTYDPYTARWAEPAAAIHV